MNYNILINFINNSADINHLFLLKLNNFKYMNQLYGIKIGNKIIQKVLNILNKPIYLKVRGQKVKIALNILHIYGVQFLFYVKDNNNIKSIKLNELTQEEIFDFEQQLLILIKEIIEKIEHKFIIIEDKKIKVMLSCVILIKKQENQFYDNLLLLEEKLEENKYYNKKYSTIFNDKESNKKIETIELLNDVIFKKEGKIILDYMPIVNNKTKTIEKYEALIRILYKGKKIFPNDFLNISKEIRVYSYLTQQMIDTVFNDFEDLGAQVSFNLSFEDLLNNEIIKQLLFKINNNLFYILEEQFKIKDEDVKTILEEYYINNNLQNVFLYIKKIKKRFKDIQKIFNEIIKIIHTHEKENLNLNKYFIEITEEKNIINDKNILEVFKMLKRIGYKLVLDDFGSNYSNYNYLNEYPFDVVKIDGLIAKNLPDNIMFIDFVSNYCKSKNIQTVIESVENEGIYDLIKEKIDYSQGYYFGQPQAIKNQVVIPYIEPKN